MSTQPRSDLKSTAPIRVSRNAMNPFGWQHDLAGVGGLTAALRRARGRAETVGRARRPLLAGAHRDLREPLTAMLRLNNDWDARGTDMVAVRMIEQQRQALEVMA